MRATVELIHAMYHVSMNEFSFHFRSCFQCCRTVADVFISLNYTLYNWMWHRLHAAMLKVRNAYAHAPSTTLRIIGYFRRRNWDRSSCILLEPCTSCAHTYTSAVPDPKTRLKIALNFRFDWSPWNGSASKSWMRFPSRRSQRQLKNTYGYG